MSRKIKNDNRGYVFYEKQYKDIELDSILSKIINNNEGQVLKLNWSDFPKGVGITINDYYYRSKYLRAFGYITISEEQFDNEEISSFEISATDEGFRFFADGGFTGAKMREGIEKKRLLLNQRITWVISILAIGVSLCSILVSYRKTSTPMQVPIIKIDTIEIMKSFKGEINLSKDSSIHSEQISAPQYQHRRNKTDKTTDIKEKKM